MPSAQKGAGRRQEGEELGFKVLEDDRMMADTRHVKTDKGLIPRLEDTRNACRATRGQRPDPSMNKDHEQARKGDIGPRS